MASYEESQKVIPNFKDSIELWIDIWSDRKKNKMLKKQKGYKTVQRGLQKKIQWRNQNLPKRWWRNNVEVWKRWLIKLLEELV